MTIKTKKFRALLAAACLPVAALLLCLYLTLKPEYGEEYKYTVKCLYRWCFWPFAIAGAAAFLALWGARLQRIPARCFFALKRLPASRAFWPFFILLALSGLACLCVPVFSPIAGGLTWPQNCLLSLCWAAGALFLGLALFFLALRLNNLASSLLVCLATLLLLFGSAEAWLLMTPQPGDGFTSGTHQSKYILEGKAAGGIQWHMTPLGLMPEMPAHPSASFAQRELYFGEPLFDVRYTFDDKVRRILPEHADNPGAEIMLFGCSFTFGFGLENEEAWPWKLSEILGPDWKIVDYAFNGYGANQMYMLLESDMVEQPQAPFRQALFLALHDHVRRFSGLFGLNCPVFTLRDGVLQKEGMTDDSIYAKILRIPHKFNGSQTMREAAGWFSGQVMKRREGEFKEVYVRLIVESAKILREKYDASLTVLLWPNIEDIAGRLEESGISVLFARKMLTQWETKGGSAYHIVPNLEFHPNTLATTELAAGLAEHFRKLYAAQAQTGARQ